MSEGHLVVVEQAAGEDIDDRRAGPPADVEAWHRVAVSASAVTAALGPPDDRKRLQPTLAKPAPLLAGGEVDVRVRPLPRPVVFGAVECRRTEPVLQRQVVAVADAEPALLGAVDEEQSAERPERLAADVVGVLLVDDQDPTAAFGQFTCGDETCETCTHDDDISVCHPATLAGSVYAASVNALY